MAGVLTCEKLRQIVEAVPDGWLAPDNAPEDAAAVRAAYHAYLTQRLTAPRPFIDEALRAR
jgi:hypothetical protein